MKIEFKIEIERDPENERKVREMHDPAKAAVRAEIRREIDETAAEVVRQVERQS